MEFFFILFLLFPEKHIPINRRASLNYLFFITGCEDNKDLENISAAQSSPTISFWFRLNKIIIRLCSTHQFKNLQVRYNLIIYILALQRKVYDAFT